MVNYLGYVWTFLKCYSDKARLLQSISRKSHTLRNRISNNSGMFDIS